MEAPYSETAELQARGPFLHGYHKSEKEKEGHRTGGGLFLRLCYNTVNYRR